MGNINNELINTNGFIYKIKQFFKNMFKKNIAQNDISQKDIEKRNNFRDNITVKEDTEKSRLLKLQEMFRNGQLSEDDISMEDIEKLSKLYDEQIDELQEKIKQNVYATDNYKKQIILMKNKINSKNNI